ncbi:hypothetical protein FB472_1249 [Rhodoglobus vestalii]|uniref:Uncharacterized protein n=1 Tax=Rhodoglobus vestalii TaxID=193384 RepID=A0A8H2K6C3_9MICO|nr:hypothetical protein FB472_1249 [Rhodoglobus vestalii]
MARANLGKLLGNVGDKGPFTLPLPDASRIEVAAPGRPRIAVDPVRSSTRKKTVLKESNERTRPTSDAPTPTYLRYVRKETRIREDQQNQLTVEARRLNRAKKSQGARITENSLIRVAIDLLLAQIGIAAGDDEDSIRKSMTS